MKASSLNVSTGLTIATALLSIGMLSANAAAFITKTTSTPNPQKHGKPVVVTTTVTAQSGLKSGVVDIEVYNAAGQKVGQQWTANTNVAAHKPTPYKLTWTPNAPGMYAVKIGIFQKNAKTPALWDNEPKPIVIK